MSCLSLVPGSARGRPSFLAGSESTALREVVDLEPEKQQASMSLENSIPLLSPLPFLLQNKDVSGELREGR